jgi:hypothetical protein
MHSTAFNLYTNTLLLIFLVLFFLIAASIFFDQQIRSQVSSASVHEQNNNPASGHVIFPAAFNIILSGNYVYEFSHCTYISNQKYNPEKKFEMQQLPTLLKLKALKLFKKTTKTN